MPELEPPSDLQVALAATSAAVKIIEDRRFSQLQQFAKKDADFVTDVDLAAEAAILAILGDQRPEDAVRGEESGTSGGTRTRRTWLVDPLCGTMNYASGSPSYAVNIALVQDDDVLAAVVAEPAAGRIYVADGSAAYEIGGKRAIALVPGASSRLIEVHLESADPNRSGFSSTRFLRSSTFTSFKPRYLGTALPLAWVATGGRAAMVIASSCDFDVHFAAGIGLCRAAGCVLSDLHGGPARLDSEAIVVAADAATHRLILQGVAEQLD
jgi:myo-inositol-1(or 4)-monophosphatase